MRIVAIIAMVFVLVLGVIFGVLFTQPGNNLARPYLEKKIAQTLQKEVRIEQFSLRFSSVVLGLRVDEGAVAEVRGSFGLFDRRFDLEYGVDIVELETPVVSIRERIWLTGTAKGFPQDLVVQGAGKALGSDVSYAVSLKNGVLSGAQGEALGLELGDVLGLLGQPRFATGVLDVRAQMNAQEEMVATLKLGEGVVQEAVVKERFGLALPQHTQFDIRVNANLKETLLKGTATLHSSVAQISLGSFEADVQTFRWGAQGNLDVPSLAQFEETVGMPLAGELKVDFEAKGLKEVFEASLKTHSLGGEAHVVVSPTQARIDGQGLRLEAILARLGQPRFSQGLLHVKGKVAEFGQDAQAGDFTLAIAEGVPNAKEIMELFAVELPKDLKYGFSASGVLQGQTVTFESALESTVATLVTSKGVFQLKEGAVQTPYRLHVEELAKLASLTGQTLYGPLEMEGEAGFNAQGIHAKGSTEVIGGESTFAFENNRLEVAANGFTFKRFSELLDVPYVFESVGTAMLWYETQKDEGAFSVVFPEGRLVESELTGLVQLATGFNMAREVYQNTILEGTIDPKNILFGFKMEGAQSTMHVEKGLLGRENGNLDVPFAIVVQEKDLSGTVKGDMHKPKVSIRASQYLQQKLDKKIEKHVPDEAKGIVRDLLKLF
jgi:hypothetical protein